MSQTQWVKISEFAKQQGVTYSSAHRLVTNGKLKSKQLASGTILVRSAEIQAPAMAASAMLTIEERRRVPFAILLATPLLAVATAFGIAAATGALDYSFVPQMFSAVTQPLSPNDNSTLKEAARDGAVTAQVATSEGGWQQLEKVHLQSTDSTYVKLEANDENFTVTAVNRQSGEAYRYESATGRFVPTKVIYDVNSRSYR